MKTKKEFEKYFKRVCLPTLKRLETRNMSGRPDTLA